MKLIDLDREERLRLLQFVCAFAWADLEVHPEERSFVMRLVRRLGLDEKDESQVERWLEVPPSPDQVDPQDIPAAHKQVFLAAIDGVIAADGQIQPEERESLRLLQQLLR